MKRLLSVIIFVLLLTVSAFAKGGVVDEAGTTGIPSPANDKTLKRVYYLDSFQKRFENSKVTENIHHIQFSPDQIIKILLRENMQTTLVLPKGEEVMSIDLRDKLNFRISPKPAPLSNVAILYGINPGADTNLTIFGKSGNIYSIYLRIYATKVKDVAPDFLIYVDDPSVEAAIEAQKANDVALAAAEESKGKSEGECLECQQKNSPKEQSKGFDPDYLRSLPVKVDPAEINLSYVTSKGDMALQPLKIWDDGYWTYFQMDVRNLDKLSESPVPYIVNSAGFEELVNFRVNGGTLIAETVNAKWTLRSGDSYLCIREVDAHDR